jgi:hypothetical protein
MTEGHSCTCVAAAPLFDHGRARTLSGYAVYLSHIEDDTQFDSACPFHGEHGSMVVRLDA